MANGGGVITVVARTATNRVALCLVLNPQDITLNFVLSEKNKNYFSYKVELCSLESADLALHDCLNQVFLRRCTL